MITLTMRPYAGEADVQPIVDMVNSCNVADQLGDITTCDQLRHELTHPQIDPARDIQLWENEDGRLIGLGQMQVAPSEGATDGPGEGRLWISLHPTARASGIGELILAWAEERLRAASREHGEPFVLRVAAFDREAYLTTLLEAQGFTIVRAFYHMERSLTEPLPAPRLPEGFTVRPSVWPTDLPAQVALFNESFIDHWNYEPLTMEQAEHYCSAAYYRPELLLLAVAPDGRLAAFCNCRINPEENARTGRAMGWVDALGTRRGYRRLGLGRAMLRTGLQQLQQEGMTSARLGVDTQNPNGALQIYTAEGFETFRTLQISSRDVPAVG